MTRRLEGFTPLWPAEQRLVDWIRAGNMEPFRVSGSLPPEDAPKEVRLRASFVRYLALGGCDVCRVLEKGLGVWGAYIEGDGPDWAETRGLDLEGCDLSCDLALFRCRFPDLLMLRSASVRSLYLEGSNLHVGLIADGLKANGSVVLNNLQSQGEVRLLSAHLGGYLACEGGSLTASAGSKALSADGLEVNGSVFLRDLKARGAVRLLGARLGGDLSCLDARLTATAGGDALLADRLDVKGIVFLCGLEALGEVRLLGARLGGDLDCNGVRLTARPGGRALNGDGMRVEGTFFLRAGAHMDGVLDLTGAQIGHLNDSPACWPEPGKLALDRCRYGAFTGLSPVNAASRIRCRPCRTKADGERSSGRSRGRNARACCARWGMVRRRGRS